MAADNVPGSVAWMVTGLLLPKAVVLPKYPGSLYTLPSGNCMANSKACSKNVSQDHHCQQCLFEQSLELKQCHCN